MSPLNQYFFYSLNPWVARTLSLICSIGFSWNVKKSAIFKFTFLFLAVGIFNFECFFFKFQQLYQLPIVPTHNVEFFCLRQNDYSHDSKHIIQNSNVSQLYCSNWNKRQLIRNMYIETLQLRRAILCWKKKVSPHIKHQSLVQRKIQYLLHVKFSSFIRFDTIFIAVIFKPTQLKVPKCRFVLQTWAIGLNVDCSS